MTTALIRPSYADYARTDLVLEVARLGLAVEGAAHHAGPVEEAATRARFHHAMAMLLALVEAEQEDVTDRDRVVAQWVRHEQLVEDYLAELAKLEGDHAG
ncbi:hypothetical protein [Halomonas borealis]|uniref:hypothetical protein n=1 Tax=Halomonas borealis TaxID=2508710 RepID=UPI0010A0459A|nr:hypothetical protein [Halomonas borealis]